MVSGACEFGLEGCGELPAELCDALFDLVFGDEYGGDLWEWWVVWCGCVAVVHLRPWMVPRTRVRE
mgnify:CR=1 FL=1